MKQASIQAEPTQYHYANNMWLYNFIYAFFFGFEQNNDYCSDLKPRYREIASRGLYYICTMSRKTNSTIFKDDVYLAQEIIVVRKEYYMVYYH